MAYTICFFIIFAIAIALLFKYVIKKDEEDIEEDMAIEEELLKQEKLKTQENGALNYHLNGNGVEKHEHSATEVVPEAPIEETPVVPAAEEILPTPEPEAPAAEEKKTAASKKKVKKKPAPKKGGKKGKKQ